MTKVVAVTDEADEVGDDPRMKLERIDDNTISRRIPPDEALWFEVVRLFGMRVMSTKQAKVMT